MNIHIEYTTEETLDPEEFRDLLVLSTLAERRPVDDDARLADMVKHANLIITARLNGKLVGVSRSLTDFAFCTYLSDLAVHTDFQKQGIGKKLIWLTKLATPKALLILLSAPKATEYYPRIGMKGHPHCYILADIKELDMGISG